MNEIDSLLLFINQLNLLYLWFYDMLFNFKGSKHLFIILNSNCLLRNGSATTLCPIVIDIDCLHLFLFVCVEWSCDYVDFFQMQLYNADSSSGSVARATTSEGASKLTQEGDEPSDSDDCGDSPSE